MAITKISDLVIVPETFLEYVEKLIMERSQFFQSGIVVNVPTAIPSKGKITNAPSYLGFTGDDEVLSDSGALTPGNIDSINAVSVINFRGKAYGANDLVGQLAGQDPLGDIASKYADYWVRMLNRTTVSTISGAAGGLDAVYGAGQIVLDISGNAGAASNIDVISVIDTTQLMGEYEAELDIMVMHSSVYSYLRKVDANNSNIVQSSSDSSFQTYQGKRVVIDDTLVDNAGVYDTYFAGAGSMVYAEGINPRLAIETDRDILAGDDIITSRKRYLMHASGSSWAGTPVGVSPTNAELATAGNWTPEDVSDANRFMVRVLRHKIDQV